jgi:hypothetical protein
MYVDGLLKERPERGGKVLENVAVQARIALGETLV